MAKSDKDAGAASVAVFGFEGCSAWVAAGLLELFAVGNVALNNLPSSVKRASRAARFDCHLIGESGGKIRGSHGVSFEAQRPRRRYDAVIVPPIWCESREELEQRALELESRVRHLRSLARRARIMASACSGAVLPANAGLLSRRRATTCWWLASWFQQRYPDVDLAPDKLIVADGDRWTAAAGSAYLHLGVELIEELAGPKVAAATARLLLVERRRGSQSPFIVQDALPSGAADSDVDRAIAYLQEHAGTRITIAQLCGRIAVNERTLSRKFKAALGASPLAYLQSRRIGDARRLLETTALSLEDIVAQCGYEDVASFRKLFARHVGMTPREYRSRFGVSEGRIAERR
jgi:transcriptional regulator GlxA family with amidase domain